MKEIKEKYDKGITEYFKNGEIGKGLELLQDPKKIINNPAKSIPLMMKIYGMYNKMIGNHGFGKRRKRSNKKRKSVRRRRTSVKRRN